MSMSVGDVIQIADVQTFLSQRLLNVYFYEVVSADPDATLENVAQSFELQVATEVAALQSNAVTHSQIQVKNLTNGIDIWEEPASIIGTATTGNNTPSFTALGFRLIRSTAVTRHGSKRIGGLVEEQINGNTIESAQMVTVAAVQAAMASNITAEGTTADFELRPVIVGRFPQGSPNAGELDLSVINPVSAVQYIRVTTQTTRRAGRGV